MTARRTTLRQVDNEFGKPPIPLPTLASSTDTSCSLQQQMEPGDLVLYESHSILHGKGFVIALERTAWLQLTHQIL